MATKPAGTKRISTTLTTRYALPAFLATFAVTSCGSPGHVTSASGTTTPEPATTATATTQEAVVSAYDALWPAGQQAEAAPTAERAAILAPYATGNQLTTMLTGIDQLRADGRRTWGHIVLHAYDVTVDGSNATVQDCQDDSQAGQINVSTGERLTHGGLGVHLVATLQRGADGVWRVEQIAQVKRPCLLSVSPSWQLP